MIYYVTAIKIDRVQRYWSVSEENPYLTQETEIIANTFLTFQQAKKLKNYILTQPQDYKNPVIKKHTMDEKTVRQIILERKILTYGNVVTLIHIVICAKCEESAATYSLKTSKTQLLRYCANCEKYYVTRSPKTPLEKKWVNLIRVALSTK